MNTQLIPIYLLFILILFPCSAKGQEPLTLGLKEARDMALSHNKLLQLQKEKANESAYKIKTMAAKGKPLLYASGNYLHSFNENNFVIPGGSIGDLLDIPIPWNDFTLYRGNRDIFTAGVLAYQPLTQIFRVHHGVKAIRAEAKMENSKAQQAALEIQTAVEKLFYAVKIQEKKITAATAAIELVNARLYDAESARMAGEIQEVEILGLKAEKAGKEHDLTKAEIARDNYLADLHNTLSLADSVPLVLAPLPETSYILQSEMHYREQALQNNPELQAAKYQLEKAEHGVAAARNAYLPDFGITGGATYQGIIKELPETNYFVGANLTWNFLDFGKRKSELQQQTSKQLQAKLFAENTLEEIEHKIGKAYRNALQAKQLTDAAQRAYHFRKEEYRIRKDGLDTGLITKKELLETKVELEKAAQNAYAAQLNYNLAIVDLKVLTGTIP